MSILLPHKFQEIRRRFGDQPFALLDVGAGNHSARTARQWFPRCRYTGIDRERGYDNDAADFAAMEQFFELDLTTLRFDAIPDAAYDVILMAHVIEHLHNGDRVLRGLAPKLKPGGLIYIEFPGPRSLQLPSKRGTLNFWDDPTHVRVFTSAEIAGLLTSLGFRVVRAGVRRDWLRIALTPAIAVHSKWKNGYVAGGVFWDLLGFAEGVVALKNGGAPAAPPSMPARA